MENLNISRILNPNLKIIKLQCAYEIDVLDAIIYKTRYLKSLSLINNKPFPRYYLRLIFNTLEFLRDLTIRGVGCNDEYPTKLKGINLSHSKLVYAKFHDLDECEEVRLKHARASRVLSIEYLNTQDVNI